MCGIIVTNDPTALQAMYDANATRGKHSYSFCTLNKDMEILSLIRELGLISPQSLSWLIDNSKSAELFIMHNQAPTTEARSIDNVHPYYCERHGTLTWHNGILKPDFVTRYGVTWDTQVLSEFLTGFGELSDVDGSFAFVHYKDMARRLFVGRNELCPLFYKKRDDKFYLSSVAVDFDYKELPPNVAYKLGVNGNLEVVSTFKTFEMPYYLGEE